MTGGDLRPKCRRVTLPWCRVTRDGARCLGVRRAPLFSLPPVAKRCTREPLPHRREPAPALVCLEAIERKWPHAYAGPSPSMHVYRSWTCDVQNHHACARSSVLRMEETLPNFNARSHAAGTRPAFLSIEMRGVEKKGQNLAFLCGRRPHRRRSATRAPRQFCGLHQLTR